MSLDSVINTLVSDAQIEMGDSLSWLNARGLLVRRAKRGEHRPKRWTPEEEHFYLEHLHDMTIEQIAAALGRTANAIKVHRFRAGHPSHRRTPGYLTTHQVAQLLGVDSHVPPNWVDCGIMPGERVPYESDRPMRRVPTIQFKLWLVRPTSWIYFKANRIKNPSLRRLVELAQKRWGDEWWSTTEAALHLGCTPDDIDRQITIGKISGIQLRSGRRMTQRWAYWYVRRSDVEKLVVRKGKGARGYDREDYWTDRSDAFLLRARASGKTWAEIGRMMKWPEKRCSYRWCILKKRGIA